MRLGSSAKYSLQRDIMSDLYDAAEGKLTERRNVIAGKNLLLQLEPYEAVIAQLPYEFLHRDTAYKVEVKYKSKHDNAHKIDEVWWYYSPDTSPILMPYGRNSLLPPLYQEASDLAEEIIVLNNERKAMGKFLQDTLDEFSGINQLKKVWPEAIHKYLPIPKTKPKKPSAAKQREALAAAAANAPTGLGTRLVTNLLESE